MSDPGGIIERLRGILDESDGLSELLEEYRLVGTPVARCGRR